MAAAKSRVVKRFIIIRFRFVFMTYDIFLLANATNASSAMPKL